MATVFLSIIYITFISLGLPDSLLGVGWPEMYRDLAVPQSYAGLVSMTISFGTITSSFFSGKLIRKFGTGKLTAVSVLGTATALLGFYLAPAFGWVLVAAVPLGLGAGAVDAALNEYVAENYQAHHMNWLHSFWGIGALTSPLIMSQVLSQDRSWRVGYLVVAVIQFILAIVLLMTLPMWRGKEQKKTAEQQERALTLSFLIKMKKVRLALYAFFLYIGVEATMGLWSSSYLINVKGIDSSKAAIAVSGFFGFIMFGRLISGFVSMLLTNRQLIRIGQILIVSGALLLILAKSYPLLLLGICLIGFGCAPIYPAMLHETPERFGQAIAQQIMGIQMAIAYTGSVVLPPLFGFLAPKLGMEVLPIFLIGYGSVMYVASELLNKKLDAEGQLNER
ncbi:MFS transporter [Vagococcus sp. BWB3-3]|uniref:MFS transporter n=1 Tax=Vagococcus allomyrinae TaxID=2794353 RepID=A0A940SYW2_9ENTE|nr:MFS transporter [Vagococcus allomyrinae]MBP1043813.1 MFS transporter [Vagococcus allomyrinae]